jgi:phosphoribosylanthranilate isomerase
MPAIATRIKKVGVFVNASYDEIMQQVNAYQLDMVQLHGEESPEQLFRLSQVVSTIKAFGISSYHGLQHTINEFKDATHYFLFDTKGDAYGGTGEKFDWSVLSQIQFSKPFFLSGGIGANDITSLRVFRNNILSSQLHAVDVNSKFEISPGVKDLGAIESFISALRVKQTS